MGKKHREYVTKKITSKLDLHLNFFNKKSPHKEKITLEQQKLAIKQQKFVTEQQMMIKSKHFEKRSQCIQQNEDRIPEE